MPTDSTAPRSGLGDVNPLFRHPRDFDRQTENRPYLDEFGGSDIDFSDEESDDESDDGHPDNEPDSGTNGGPSQEAVDFEPTPRSAVRRLSNRLGTDQPTPDSYQDSEVIKFVEHGLKITPAPSEGNDQPFVALIDDQTDTGGGQSCRGGLTRSHFSEELHRPRFIEPHMVPAHSEGDSEPVADIKRRVIGVPGLAAPEMEVLASSATPSQRTPLLKFFRHHINPSPSFACDIPSSGFRTLSLQFHIPYVVLRQHGMPYKDSRRKPSGDPLRFSRPVDCIPATRSRGQWHIHQAQRSLAVVVIDERRWTAFGTADTFFDGSKSKDSVARRHNLWAKDDPKDRLKIDPIRYWRMYSVRKADGVRVEGGDGDLLSDPYMYFLAMLEWAMIVAQLEYAPIVAKMQEVVDNGYPAEGTGQARDFGKWNDDALEHIRIIMTCLRDLLDAWETFQKGDPRYFDIDTHSRYRTNIKQSFDTLEGHHKRLAELKKKLKGNEARIKKQLNMEVRDAQHYAQALAILIIVFSPLTQVMTLFNMQGLPFDLSLASFTLSCLVIGCLWFVVYWLVMRGITSVLAWRVHVRCYIGRATAWAWERLMLLVWRPEVFELQGSQPVEGFTTAVQEPPKAVTRNRRAATWPFTRRRWDEMHEMQNDPIHNV
ncbi:hypothetical protein QBC39DRAFT_81551 [Podospora conica]|nr:hypothetical protein QBC39DRAFT_81551 [Schizothecium conicum]